MQIISDFFYVQGDYNIVIYRPGVGALLIIHVQVYQSLSGIMQLIASTPFFYTGMGLHCLLNLTNMNTNTCPCLLRIDLEHAIDKLNFLKEYYLPIIDETFTSLSVKELTCCLCLINSVLKSIEEGSYVCSNQEVISLYEKKKQIICLLI